MKRDKAVEITVVEYYFKRIHLPERASVILKVKLVEVGKSNAGGPSALSIDVNWEIVNSEG